MIIDYPRGNTYFRFPSHSPQIFLPHLKGVLVTWGTRLKGPLTNPGSLTITPRDLSPWWPCWIWTRNPMPRWVKVTENSILYLRKILNSLYATNTNSYPFLYIKIVYIKKFCCKFQTDFRLYWIVFLIIYNSFQDSEPSIQIYQFYYICNVFFLAVWNPQQTG